mmetsp:Transcript_16946/g.29332  ORF Transcript_16946/g.29332 Transcript_16946/m.29332 type:complete len:315 (-) Transcript_16946:301-1245(-)
MVAHLPATPNSAGTDRCKSRVKNVMTETETLEMVALRPAPKSIAVMVLYKREKHATTQTSLAETDAAFHASWSIVVTGSFKLGKNVMIGTRYLMMAALTVALVSAATEFSNPTKRATTEMRTNLMAARRLAPRWPAETVSCNAEKVAMMVTLSVATAAALIVGRKVVGMACLMISSFAMTQMFSMATGAPRIASSSFVETESSKAAMSIATTETSLTTTAVLRTALRKFVETGSSSHGKAVTTVICSAEMVARRAVWLRIAEMVLFQPEKCATMAMLSVVMDAVPIATPSIPALVLPQTQLSTMFSGALAMMHW